ncbi:unnamed protein product [Lepeophtheirus salmonis]|uniref:(salmon louse) hypothetical protein n=1 Tax=Lepeophtheirus salmonis TaxID=72036 RepID=A0A0K2TMT9_LEPSM|nr:uncharacterized protein LOC121122737 [Lepeophtheirus salmonis]XP_040573705.1 uncharacterized protein LOC121122737 [Lepeophtheirus salmonis]XP_040573706.1 uncharacterized protein LOC121122737 [Lepeophtheirus salmonis]XP_040573707.1 uncharacterized protein LOC121122737 [Lepeophtheirus salmonis]CAB4069312.1 unnamed protein product [Lepeophtheirus salmonis]CAF3025188.1 unnamed protein product [Lepeophtheirus salmonis]
MKSKKSSKFKFSFSSTPSSANSSLSSSLRKDSIALDKKSDVQLLSVKRKTSNDDSGWESSTPSTSSCSSTSRKSSSSSNFFKLFHRSAATLLLPKRSENEFDSFSHPHRPSRTNVFIKNEELDLDSLPPSNKQTSFVTKARRRSSKLQARSLSAVNLMAKRHFEDDSEEGSSVISGCTSSTITSSLSPLRRHSVSSLLSSRYESAKESYDYDSGAYSRTSSPDDKSLPRASSHLAISAPLSAPSLVLAACMNFSGDVYNLSNVKSISPLFCASRHKIEDDNHRVSVTIGAHTKLSIAAGRGRCPLLGTAGLSPGKRSHKFLMKKSPSPSGLTRSKISTVYLGKNPKKNPFCSCGEQVTVNGRHHCTGDRSCFSDTDSELGRSFLQF